MKPISDFEFEKNIKAIRDSVFASIDPYGSPFHEDIQYKLLLYEFTYGIEKNDIWFHPLVESIRSLGEEGFYVSLLRRSSEEPSHWYVPLAEAHEYIKVVLPAENTIYSVHGKWGLICSEEDHAVIGGPEKFISIIYEAIPDWDNRIQLFLENWKIHYKNNSIDLGWMPVLLSHVYGLSKCKDLLESSDMGWLIK